MSRLAYVESHGERRAFFDPADGRRLETAERFDALLLSRLDFDVRLVKLPAIAGREIEGFLRYRSRSLYPGQPEETSIDYSLILSHGERYAVVFLGKREVVEDYRQAAGGKALFLPFGFYRPYLQRDSRLTRVCTFWQKQWIDVFVFGPETVMRSTVLKRGRSFEQDWGRLQRVLPDGMLEAGWLAFCGSVDREAIKRSLPEGAGDKVRFVPLEALDLRRFRRNAAFAERPATRRIPRAVAVPALTAVLLLLTILLVKKGVDRQEAYAGELRRMLAGYEQSTARLVALEKDIEELTARRERLLAKVPLQPYSVLSELWAVMGPTTRIQSFSFEKGTFELEAVGTDPLEMMNRFGDRDRFEDVKLMQIVPLEGTNRELFRIRGRTSAP